MHKINHISGNIESAKKVDHILEIPRLRAICGIVSRTIRVKVGCQL